MRIIVEGPDGAGKTTLIAALAQRLDLKVVRHSHADFKRLAKVVGCDPGELLRRHIEEILEDNITLADGYIHDRWYYPSDVIYCPIVEGHTSPIAPYAAGIEAKLKELQVLVIYVRADVATLQSRLAARGDDYVQAQQLEQILAAYELFVDNTEIPFVQVGTSSGRSVAETVEDLVESIQLYSRRIGQ